MSGKLIDTGCAGFAAVLASDAPVPGGGGALLCHAAIESAAMNVFISTKSLKNRDKAKEIEAAVDSLMERYFPIAGRTAMDVMGNIRNRG